MTRKKPRESEVKAFAKSESWQEPQFGITTVSITWMTPFD